MGLHPLRSDFAKYAELSFWRDVPFIEPQSYKDMKKMGQSHWNYGHYAAGILWFMKYSYGKLLAKLAGH